VPKPPVRSVSAWRQVDKEPGETGLTNVEHPGLMVGKETLAARLLDCCGAHWHLFVSLTVDTVLQKFG
jgi:hypothetical protein